jgi:peptidoglycan/LPS O-acetylase OafA/YrhL
VGRLRALDGLRALAVIAVLASHTLNRAEGGFLGVDVFFVLSGYLITSLLIREHDISGRIDYAAFYRRRAARLVPAYLLMLAVTVPLMAGPLRDAASMGVPAAVASSAFYLANWAQAADVDHLGPLMHTWSLSVEEQFYLLWPACFVLLTRRTRRPARWVAGATVVAVVARAVGWAVHPGTWPYFTSVTHGDGLLIGALVAMFLARRDRCAADRFTGTLAWAAAAMIGAEMLVMTIDGGPTYFWGLTLAALASAALVRHLVAAPDGAMARLLSPAPLVAVGRVSYGLYLYHLPVFMLVQQWHLGMGPTLILEIGATSAITAFSWFTVEQPTQRWIARRWPRSAAPRAVPAGLCITSA